MKAHNYQRQLMKANTCYMLAYSMFTMHGNSQIKKDLDIVMLDGSFFWMVDMFNMKFVLYSRSIQQKSWTSIDSRKLMGFP